MLTSSKIKKEITHIDLFSGPGGICTGFKSLGIKTLFAVEYVDTTCITYSANHPEVKVICDDVRNITNRKIKKELSTMGHEKVDIVTAGFPCETFSTAGSKSRVYNDHRNDLFREAIRIADVAKANLLILENVPALLSKRLAKDSERKIYDEIVDELENKGFKYHEYRILNASNYGVPQNRQRFILFASKKHYISQEVFETVNEKMLVNVGEAISDLPLIGPAASSEEYLHDPRNEFQKIMRSRNFWIPEAKDGMEKNLTYHITTKHRPSTIERLKLIKPGEGLKSLFERFSPIQIAQMQEMRVLPKKWYIQRNQRLVAEKSSHTVTSHCLDEIVHPSLDRALSVREAARLQSFPDWYDFKGGPLVCPHIYKTQDKFEQIGDAVPPLLARHIGKLALELLNNNHNAINVDHKRSDRKVLSSSIRTAA
jgi:DNA (cytosine-5)-methyltransferase 1